jgi:hypothetical protein
MELCVTAPFQPGAMHFCVACGSDVSLWLRYSAARTHSHMLPHGVPGEW